MLADLLPHELAEARAAYEVIPLDDGWRQTDTLGRAICNSFTSYSYAKAGKEVPPDALCKEGSFIPRVVIKKPNQITVNEASIAACLKTIEDRHGQYRQSHGQP